MDDGIIASRYAKALLKYVLETGNGDLVCAQVLRLERPLAEVPQLRMILDNPEDVSAAQKLSLFRAALGGEPMAPELERFLVLVLEKGRVPLLRLMFRDFVAMYNRSQNVLQARVTTAAPASEAFLERLRGLLREKTGCEVALEVRTDPELIGGFVLDLDDRRMDASLARSLRDIRRKFEEYNRRIV